MDKRGLAQLKSKSVRLMDLGKGKATFRTGERITLTITQLEIRPVPFMAGPRFTYVKLHTDESIGGIREFACSSEEQEAWAD